MAVVLAERIRFSIPLLGQNRSADDLDVGRVTLNPGNDVLSLGTHIYRILAANSIDASIHHEV